MPASGIAEPLDVVEQIGPRLIAVVAGFPGHAFALEALEKALHRRIVPAVAVMFAGAVQSIWTSLILHISIVQHLLYRLSMEKLTATTIFESLSSGLRLDVYRLLVRKGMEGMVAGEIATTLDVPPTNLSFHLKALTQAHLLTVEQEGRFQRYRANMPLMLELIDYLTEECCAGHPEQCADIRSESRSSEALLPPLPSTPRKRSNKP